MRLEYFSIVQNEIRPNTRKSTPADKGSDFFMSVIHEVALKMLSNTTDCEALQIKALEQLRDVVVREDLPQQASLSDGIIMRYLPAKAEMLIQLRDTCPYVYDYCDGGDAAPARTYSLCIKENTGSNTVLLTEGLGFDAYTANLTSCLKATPKFKMSSEKETEKSLFQFADYYEQNVDTFNVFYSFFNNPITHCCNHFCHLPNICKTHSFTLNEYQNDKQLSFKSLRFFDLDAFKEILKKIRNNHQSYICSRSIIEQQSGDLAINRIVILCAEIAIIQAMIQRADVLRNKLESRFRQTPLKKIVSNETREQKELAALKKACDDKDRLFQTQQDQNKVLRQQLTTTEETVRALSTQLENATRITVISNKEADKNSQIIAMEKKLTEMEKLLLMTKKALTTQKLINEHLTDKLSRPTKLSDVAEWVETRFAGKIVLLSRAVKLLNSASPSNVDIDILCDAIEYLAEEYRDCLLQKITPDELSHICSVKYNRPFHVKPTGDEYLTRPEYNIRYKGSNQFLALHFIYGCAVDTLIRIYFFYDKKEKKLVIGSLPYHLPCYKIKA